jgi:hypothetical protein
MHGRAHRSAAWLARRGGPSPEQHGRAQEPGDQGSSEDAILAGSTPISETEPWARSVTNNATVNSIPAKAPSLHRCRPPMSSGSVPTPSRMAGPAAPAAPAASRQRQRPPARRRKRRRAGRIRRIIAALLRKAAATTFPHVAAVCRQKAEALRAKYGLCSAQPIITRLAGQSANELPFPTGPGSQGSSRPRGVPATVPLSRRSGRARWPWRRRRDPPARPAQARRAPPR